MKRFSLLNANTATKALTPLVLAIPLIWVIAKAQSAPATFANFEGSQTNPIRLSGRVKSRV